MPPLEDSEPARIAALQEFSAFHATSDAWATQMQRYFARMPKREVSPSFASSRSDNLSDADYASVGEPEPWFEPCIGCQQLSRGGAEEGQHEEEEEEEEATGEATDEPEQRSPPATTPKKRSGLLFF
jgi:hypothetical protein